MTCFLIDEITMKNYQILASMLSAFLLVGCSSISPSSSSSKAQMKQAIAQNDKVAMLPVANFTDVAQAGLRVEVLLETALRQIGIRQLVVYPAGLSTETLFESNERKVQGEAEKWAVSQGFRYAVSASVNEWRYKVGVDGEPAVGLMIQVKDLQTNEVAYSAAGGRTGGGREALAAVGLQLVAELVAGIPVAPVGKQPGNSTDANAVKP